MKKIMIIAASVFFLCLKAHQQEAFFKANKAYEQGDYDTALQLYTDLENKGGGVYFNMGNAYYKKGDYVRALLNWKKAQRLLRGAQLRMALESSKKAEEKLSVYSSTFFEPLVYIFGPHVSYLPMLLMQLVWLLFVFGMLIGSFKRTGYQRAGIVLVCLIGLSCVGAALAIKKAIILDNGAIVTGKKVSLFAGPNDCYHHIASLELGNQVSICDYNTEWCKILAGSHTGWMRSADMTRI